MPPVEFIHGEQDRWNCRTLRNVLVLDKGPHYKTLINSSMLTNAHKFRRPEVSAAGCRENK